MSIIGAQETQSEQQEENNPFAVVSEGVKEGPAATKNSEASTSQSKLVFDPSRGENNARPVGITDGMKLPGDLPSNANSNSQQRLSNEFDGNSSESSDEQQVNSVSVSESKDSNSTPLMLADVHWSVWLILIVAATAVVVWVGSRLFRRRVRSKRPRTKSNTFKPVANRLKSNSAQPVVIPVANGKATGGKPKLAKLGARRRREQESDFGTTVRETAVVAAASEFSHAGESESRVDESFGGHLNRFEASPVAVLDGRGDDEIGLFDGQAKEEAYRTNGDSSSNNGELLAELTAEISSLKESLSDVKIDRNLLSQLEMARAELEWKNNMLERSERLADDREAALNMAVQAQSELREQVTALSAELEKVKEKFLDFEKRK